MNYRQLYAIKKANKERILKVCPNCPETSGIYFLLREEDGFKYAYIGQSVNILQRLADHLQGYQYIDLSIKKHGLWSEENQTGWVVHFLEFPKEQLDEKEQYYIKKYAKYIGLDAAHPQSYHYFMQENFFKYVNIKPQNIHILKINII